MAVKSPVLQEAALIWKGISGNEIFSQSGLNFPIDKRLLQILQAGEQYYYIFNIRE
jgi:hypothetical protein